MAVHRLNVDYPTDDQDALEQKLRELDKAGEQVCFVQYFCVAPTSTFLIQTVPHGKVERRTRSEHR